MAIGLRESLEKLSLGELKNLVNHHNISQHIKVKQSKPALIESLLKFYLGFITENNRIALRPETIEYKYDINPKTGKPRAVRKKKVKAPAPVVAPVPAKAKKVIKKKVKAPAPVVVLPVRAPAKKKVIKKVIKEK